MKSGELDKLYARWFMSPIPPKKVNLNFSDERAAEVPDQVAERRAGRELQREARESALRTRRWKTRAAHELPLELGHLRRAGQGRRRDLPRLAGTGLGWTLAVSLTAWLLALLIGIAVGALRTAPSRPLALLGSAWVELFRNIPLLVQMFLWFFVVPEFLPREWGLWVKQDMPAKEFVTAALCLGFFTSARVAEQVRAGIGSLPRGQRDAALALGLTLGRPTAM
jgi:glutamate/aspartate transport system substrate-binding protein